MKKIIIVAGARPNFIKIAPIIHEISKPKNRKKINFYLVHTGQHYDRNMSGSFFNQLSIPEPDVNLKCKGKTHAEQTSSIMLEFEKYLFKNIVDLVLVVGDVTSTMSCALVAQKLHVKVAHVEAGIRSDDWSMAEEINRLVTDSITNYFFTTSKYANINLKNSGIEENRIFFVGNTMIDTLLKHRADFKKPPFWKKFKLKCKSYAVLTLHRPVNVDDGKKLEEIITEIVNNLDSIPIIFPVHPRTKKMMKKINLKFNLLHCIDPCSYFEFNYLVNNAKVVITDSGGITEEATVLGIPCMTIRDNTERPETITQGTNELIGTNPKKFKPYFDKLLNNNWKNGKVPPLWDGKTAKRIINKILDII